MFYYSKPERPVIADFIAAAAESDLSYPEIGATFARPPDGYTIDHNRIKLGEGSEVFEKAKQAIRDWKMFDFPWVELCWRDTPTRKDENVAILIRHLGLYSLNAARIVYTIDEPRRFGFAYGTLAEHGESGEERFSVEMDPDSGHIWYDLYAFSRPRHPFAKLGHPLTRMLQKRFAADSKRAMLRAVRA